MRLTIERHESDSSAKRPSAVGLRARKSATKALFENAQTSVKTRRKEFPKSVCFVLETENARTVPTEADVSLKLPYCLAPMQLNALTTEKRLAKDDDPVMRTLTTVDANNA